MNDRLDVIARCGAISRQGNVCAREQGHEGCHEVYVDGDGRRWWGEMDAVGLAEQLRGAVEALERIATGGTLMSDGSVTPLDGFKAREIATDALAALRLA
jgi:hypothetical protein